MALSFYSLWTGASSWCNCVQSNSSGCSWKTMEFIVNSSWIHREFIANSCKSDQSLTTFGCACRRWWVAGKFQCQFYLLSVLPQISATSKAIGKCNDSCALYETLQDETRFPRLSANGEWLLGEFKSLQHLQDHCSLHERFEARLVEFRLFEETLPENPIRLCLQVRQTKWLSTKPFKQLDGIGIFRLRVTR